MSTELIINASLPETRIALMEGGEIQELLIERASGKGIVGNIYKGRVTRVLPGMQAAFVDIGLEKAAFLYVDDVFVHSEIWEQEEGAPSQTIVETVGGDPANVEPVAVEAAGTSEAEAAPKSEENLADPMSAEEGEDEPEFYETDQLDDFEEDDDDDNDDEDDDRGPVEMGAGPDDGSDSGDDRQGPSDFDQPAGTVAPSQSESSGEGSSGGEASAGSSEGSSSEGGAPGQPGDREGRRHRRGRRGGRNRRRRGRDREEGSAAAGSGPIKAGGGPIKAGKSPDDSQYPDSYYNEVSDSGEVSNDRSELEGGGVAAGSSERPENLSGAPGEHRSANPSEKIKTRPEFKEPRNRDRRIKSKEKSRPVRGQVSIQDLLHEGQEVLVQVAKDPISTKGARLTCHISLPGRHLVCMPTIDHVGVSRRIDRDDERRKLREYVEKYRPKGLGFIVRTASGKSQSENRIKQDIDYLSRLWDEIREKSANVTAPAVVYEDLNAVLRAIRDWVTEEIDKIVVDSRYHYNEIQRFVSHFMPSLKQKVELYHGDIPIFDAYNISTELSRALERKVWLKSGGYLVIDQAEALVAIDVNTGRYVGKKNLEDTILKTNLEAVQEIAYQLRLRNCGGMIILDLIDMEKEENKHRVYRAFEDALKKDRARPNILKISELGLIEMTRKRTRDTIVRALCESCSHCEGKGFIKSKQTVAYEIMREMEREGIERNVTKILVQAHADVIDVLAIEERETLDQIERRYRKPIYLQALGDYHPEQFEVISEKREGSKVETSRRGSRMGKQEADSRERGGRDRGRGGRDRGRGRDRGEKDRDGQQNTQGGQADRPRPAPVILPKPAVADGATGAGAGTSEGAPGLQAGATPEFENEEDRLTFLRAQAAQDAALARMGGAAGQPGAGGQGRGDRDRGGAGGDRGRGRNRRRRGRGGRGGGRDRDQRDAQPRGPAGPLPVGNRGGAEPGNSAGPTPNASSSDSGRSDGGNGGGGNGGGDNSNPPQS